MSCFLLGSLAVEAQYTFTALILIVCVFAGANLFVRRKRNSQKNKETSTVAKENENIVEDNSDSADTDDTSEEEVES